MTRRTRRALTLLLPTLHLLWCCALQFEVIPPSEGSWTWFPVFIADFPLSLVVDLLLIPLPLSVAFRVPPLLTLGIAGTVWWYWLSWGLVESFFGEKGHNAGTEVKHEAAQQVDAADEARDETRPTGSLR
jgi:Protein of unknown function (DUF1375)